MLPEQTGRDELFNRLNDLLLVATAGVLEQRGVTHATDDGGGGEELKSEFAQAVATGLHVAKDGGRVGLDATGVDRLLDQEGNTAGTLDDPLDVDVRGEVTEVLRPQRDQVDIDVSVARHLSQHRVDFLEIPGRDDHVHAPGHATTQHRDQFRRCRVDPVDVIDRQCQFRGCRSQLEHGEVGLP